MALNQIITIGVYGFDQATFFAALHKAHVDTFCDIRRRRGVRGSDYAFANSQRLQDRLATLGIRYLHLPELAPGDALRHAQACMDKQAHVARRQRTVLSADFVAGYRAECLRGFHADQFVIGLGPDTRVLALCCVEREPAACHRSLLADRLEHDLGLEVIHLKPA